MNNNAFIKRWFNKKLKQYKLGKQMICIFVGL